MISFPPGNWDIFPLEEMETRPVDVVGSASSLLLDVRVAVHPASGHEGALALKLDSGATISIAVDAAEFIPLPTLMGFTIHAQVNLKLYPYCGLVLSYMLARFSPA